MTVILDNIQLAVFDLDDTLYLENEFVTGGLHAVADELARQYGTDGAHHYRTLTALHHRRDRNKFQTLLTDLGQNPTPQAIEALVHVYRTAPRPLTLLPDADRILDRVRDAHIAAAILTDGPLEGQKTKMNLLQLADRIDHITYTAELGPDAAKPAPMGFEALTDRFHARPQQCLYIADNEKKDFAGPNRLNWHTIKVKRPHALYADHESPDELYRPHHTVASLDDIEFQ